VDLLVIGRPTPAFGMSRPQTREDAAGRGGHPSSTGMREWLDAATRATLRMATFDTHTRKPNLPGTASKAAAKRLRALGCTVVAEPEKSGCTVTRDRCRRARRNGRARGAQV
jgi:hypothetical protein